MVNQAIAKKNYTDIAAALAPPTPSFADYKQSIKT